MNKISYFSKHYPAQFNEADYLERTKRNHFWLGGTEGQYRLQKLKVGIAGLGGMGSNLAEIMVRLGVGHIKIADPDTIEHSNINRQVIANKNTVGQKKAIASANELRNITEDFELTVYEDGITEENAEEFVSDLDLIIDEIDVFPLHAHVNLHQAARKRNLPLYSGYIIGLGTHIYKFHGNEYTLEDFLQNNQEQISNPSAEFLFSRFVNPPLQHLESEQILNGYRECVQKGTVPIFGASTYMSQSLVAIRIVTDFLGLDTAIGGVKTPVMPQFLSVDPLFLKFEIKTAK